MSRWVIVLVAGSITAIAVFGSLATLFSEPFQASHVILWTMSLASGWWLIKVIRTKQQTEDVEYFEEPKEDNEGSSRIRTKGLFRVIGGSIGFPIALVFLAFLAKNGYTSSRGGIPGMVLLVIPAVIALQGVIELLTGMKFWQISEKWNELTGWQRGVLGTIIAFSPLIFIAIGMKVFID